ncbi:hypothetical protein [Tersicoccus sp. Bi-70]|uniref:hypothetical protein n=1 Tax=Tersicoccus sp. Bi-70 TaxID=1897634 RepID=UPI000977BC47|nr:hypothetical protein [Tersicoccus sp. Bi-70]OMH35145.1 hypothetical protein BGP79_02225 [Tersicoccus sp. Bi-70]
MSWLERTARRLAVINPSRKKRIAISVGVSLALGVVYLVILRATGGSHGSWSVLLVVAWFVLSHVAGRVMDGMSSGRYAGKPLDLPRARMMRDAARHYAQVTSWTSPLSAEEAFGRLVGRTQVPQVQTRAYDGALWLQLSQRRWTTSPTDPDQTFAMTVTTEAMVFIDDAPRTADGWYRPGKRSVVTVHHERREAEDRGVTMLEDHRHAAVLTDHLLIAIQDATGATTTGDGTTGDGTTGDGTTTDDGSGR